MYFVLLKCVYFHFTIVYIHTIKCISRSKFKNYKKKKREKGENVGKLTQRYSTGKQSVRDIINYIFVSSSYCFNATRSKESQ